jgi:glycosyltransferase involved in cell wall biosynthesis
MRARYAEADCLLFPSRLETWGLPISEAKQRRLAMFVADLPYARETVGSYDRADFVDISDHRAFAAKLLAFQRNEFRFQQHRAAPPDAPFAPDWDALVRELTEELP